MRVWAAPRRPRRCLWIASSGWVMGYDIVGKGRGVLDVGEKE